MTSHNKRSKKQDKNTRDGFEEIKKCPFNCGADIFYSHEMKKLLEPRTRYYHSKSRCTAIKQTHKTAEHEKNAKTLRPSVIQELKSEIASFVDGESLAEILFAIMSRRKFEIDKVTIKELAVAFYPRETYKSICGETAVTNEGISRITVMLHSLRKKKNKNTGKYANEGTLIFSKKFENGEWYYYNMQTEAQYKPVRERLTVQRDGIDETLKHNDEILDKNKDQRKKAEEAFRKLLAEKRKKRRSS